MTPKPTEKPPTTGSSPWLRRADQGAVALLVALGFFGTVVWWWSHGGPRGDLVELEQAEPRRAQFLVDVNRADWPELTQLPDIGETLARRIVESRETDGPFLAHEDLRRVKGIGPKTVDRLRPYLLPMADRETLAGR